MPLSVSNYKCPAARKKNRYLKITTFISMIPSRMFFKEISAVIFILKIKSRTFFSLFYHELETVQAARKKDPEKDKPNSYFSSKTNETAFKLK